MGPRALEHTADNFGMFTDEHTKDSTGVIWKPCSHLTREQIFILSFDIF